MARDPQNPSRPALGDDDLGFRENIDIKPDPDGRVGSNPKKGMSVFDDPARMPSRYLARDLGGDSDRPVWRYSPMDLPKELTLMISSGPHGVIAPSRMMTPEEYRSALGSTAADWVVEYE